jgi:hypothetical protein
MRKLAKKFARRATFVCPYRTGWIMKLPDTLYKTIEQYREPGPRDFRFRAAAETPTAGMCLRIAVISDAAQRPLMRPNNRHLADRPSLRRLLPEPYPPERTRE